MHEGGDYTSQYYPHHYPPTSLPNPNPNPAPAANPADFPHSGPIQGPFASAPPYSQYPPPDPSNFASAYTNYAQNPDPAVPNFPQFPHLQSFNPPPPPPPPFVQEPSPTSYSPLQQPYYAYESHQPPLNYVPPANPNPNLGPYQGYENPYESSAGGGGGGGYGFGQDFGNEGLGDGVYAYDGGKVEPYGARGTGSFGGSASFGGNSGGSGLKFDDYGRSLGPASSSMESTTQQPRIVRAVPKMESQQDVKNGVQKFRVKLLPEGASVNTTDVLCQIGLDGIRMLDPSTNRTLRIYPLEHVTRWEVLDSNIFAFWSKSPVDIDPRRIRLQSNSYTTNTILDIVTAATVQLKEMGGKESLVRSRGTADPGNPSDQTAEKKKGFVDWMNLIKPGNEEKDHWVPDEAVSKCTSCGTDFGAFMRRHHCRNCGDIFCDKCTQGRIALTADEQAQPVRVCDRCMAEVSQRLSNAKEIANKSTGIHSHEDLARKLQEEMEKNRKSSSGTKSSDGSGRRMREVACPICTVHLQVQVPSSGSETIECGVCQHPFLVSAH